MKWQDMLFFDSNKKNRKRKMNLFVSILAFSYFYKAKEWSEEEEKCVFDLTKRSQQEESTFCLSQTKRKWIEHTENNQKVVLVSLFPILSIISGCTRRRMNITLSVHGIKRLSCIWTHSCRMMIIRWWGWLIHGSIVQVRQLRVHKCISSVTRQVRID